LTCREIVELVTDYLEQALDAEERARFEEHLADCAPCQAHVDQMRRTVEVLGHLPETELSAAACRDLAAAFSGWSRS
jgi:anti-sigma factor RsiW